MCGKRPPRGCCDAMMKTWRLVDSIGMHPSIPVDYDEHDVDYRALSAAVSNRANFDA